MSELLYENAKRLLTDANLLFAHGSFSSAIALAVLSIEESLKIFLQKCGVSFNDHDHVVKQSAASCAILGRSSTRSVLNTLSSALKEMQKSGTIPSTDRLSEDDLEELLVAVKRGDIVENSAMESEILNGWMRDGSLKISEELRSGAYNDLKKASLYLMAFKGALLVRRMQHQ